MERAEPHPNGDFETDFTDKPYEPLLGIRNNDAINRKQLTADRVGSTSFSATLSRVHYGTYAGTPACLIAIDFSFRFKAKAIGRYEEATILVSFTRATDTGNPRVKSSDPSTDPQILNFAPKQVYGAVKTVEEKKKYDISIPLTFETPIGLSAGLEPHVGRESLTVVEHRMALHGNLFYDDDHDEANVVTWDLSENSAQKDGIFRHFAAAVVVANPPDTPMWMRVEVKPSVRFSLDPRYLLDKNSVLVRLMSKNDEPVLLDGKTPKKPAEQPDLRCDDFASDEFPWQKVVPSALEYANHLTLRSANVANGPGVLPTA
ncbi:uncharacterized protein BP5553_03611 [Venustampulla echinocandica]|uniref:Uncharacterized protein n=1 Tax=Venustampulla echinocandica TaxID=2656787 RepID=A0A370TUR5_9HELO|nr:uncharacterized protein BP5553_03611 [Venustampulla echinocandica]RDL39271.1 hypothetical protein BP5553_03611 [Venustampulla echinocandica]